MQPRGQVLVENEAMCQNDKLGNLQFYLNKGTGKSSAITHLEKHKLSITVIMHVFISSLITRGLDTNAAYVELSDFFFPPKINTVL